jgi:RES domain-containing protein
MLRSAFALDRRHAHDPQAATSLEHAMNEVLSVESAFVAKFLPYGTMTRLPAGYQAFAQWHFRRLRDDSLRWQDAAPAYALACLSHAAYGSALDPAVEWELELQWADLKELSRLAWPDARRLIRAAWAFLSDDNDHDGDAALPADDGHANRPPSPLGDPEADADETGTWRSTELQSAYVVLRESLAGKSPADWRTRGQVNWLSPDLRAICLALSPALAVLETVILQGFLDDEPRHLVRVAYPIALVRDIDPATEERLRDARHTDVRAPDGRRPADRWALEQRSALLRVSSLLCPGEFHLLANPLHPDFAQLQRLDAVPLNTDRRRRGH